MRSIPFLVAAVLTLVGSAASARLIGVDWEGDVWTIDENDGEGIRVGPSGVVEMNSAAVSPEGEVVSVAFSGRFASPRPSQLVTIDPRSGLASTGAVLDPDAD